MMKRLSKKLLSLLLAAVLLCGVLPFGIFATSDTEPSPVFVSDPVLFTKTFSFPPCCIPEPTEDADLPFYEEFFTDPITEEEYADITELLDAIVKAMSSFVPFDPAVHTYDPANTQVVSMANTVRNSIFMCSQRVITNINSEQMRYYIHCDAESFAAYSAALRYYTETLERTGEIIKQVAASSMRLYYFVGYTDAEIAAEVNSTVPEGFSELQNTIAVLKDKLTNDNSLTQTQFFDLYAQYVNAQNTFAGLYGYDDYYSFSWNLVYSRTYDEAEVDRYHQYMREYLPQIERAILGRRDELRKVIDPESDAWLLAKAYLGNEQSVFDDGSLSSFLLTYLDRIYEDGTDFDMRRYYDDLLARGNYFTGAYETAFTTDNGYSAPYMFFCTENLAGSGYYYCGYNAFLHEFGHYSNMVYNRLLEQDMTLHETHSQGNEILSTVHFRDWLVGRETDADAIANAEAVGEFAVNYRLLELLRLVELGLAVDEFERAAFRGYSDLLPAFEDGISPQEYPELQRAVIEQYPLASNQSLAGHSVYGTCYYISYSISAAAVVRLGADAMENGIERVRDEYTGLFTYTDNNPYAEWEPYGIVLENTGIGSPFEEEFYLTLCSELGIPTCKDGHHYVKYELYFPDCGTETGYYPYVACEVCGEIADGGSVTAIGPIACAWDRFRDLGKKSAWYHDAVDEAVYLGLFAGTSDTTFSPDGTMTRAMFVTTLWRLAGQPEADGELEFRDVKNKAWYRDAVVWGSENGIVMGTGDGCFSPDRPVTREEILSLFFRYLQKTGEELPFGADLSVFADAGRVSSFAKEAMAWGADTGILSGAKAGDALYLYPKQSATRAEGASFLVRLFSYMENAKVAIPE